MMPSPDKLALVLDSSGPQGGVALYRDGLLEERAWGEGRRSGSLLLPVIHELLQAAGLEAAAIELIVIANGPGSFTGLRVGLATAKGLAFAHGIPIVPLSTLDILAQQAPLLDGSVVSLMPARKGEVFRAEYRRQDFFCQRQSDYGCQVEEDLLASLPPETLVIGPPVAGLRQKAVRLDRGIRFADPPCNRLSLEWMNRMGQDRSRLEGDVDTASLEPWYLQEFQPTRGKIRL